ncbi:sensor histidine kinase [Evansella clarkii]|uniref:sensor histidine kinase n=1 Tax=Evansella clarkii TaxID=79879 RepID=UPI000B43216D|nr:HAMP domain-containing sensor histidine kinase [Evansella clarkii]
MKATKRRLAFRFTIQFIIFLILAVIIFGILMFVALNYISKAEMERNFPMGGLEAIINETTISEDVVTLYPGWESLLEEQEMWLQIVNKDGEVIHNVNAPDNLPNTYTLKEIMSVDETNRYGEYKVYSVIDTYYEDPYLYFLGYQNHYDDLLQRWAAIYREDIAQTEADSLAQLEQNVGRINSTLKILDSEGNIVRSFGFSAAEESSFGPVEIFARSMGISGMEKEISVFYDPDYELTWMLTTEREEGEQYGTFIRLIVIVMVIAAFVILLLGILFTVWHAARYGQPLFLFVTWLEKLGRGDYEEVLAEMEDRKILNKKGKIRGRYKLYEAVINAFREMADKLIDARDERSQLDRTREAWMTGISHDLRTPLSSMQGYAHMLESDKYNWTRNELQEIGATIREKGDYMLDLVEDFSLAFQLKNSALPLEKETVDLEQFLQRIILKLKNDISVNDYELHFKTEGKGEQETVPIRADIRLFERMILNLIYNAVQHNPPGTTVFVKVTSGEDEVKIAVHDDGKGMDEETKKFLFENYYRGVSTTDKSDGTGLGMSIAKGIAEAHNGSICVHSETGEGTIIELRFPKYSEPHIKV